MKCLISTTLLFDLLLNTSWNKKRNIAGSHSTWINNYYLMKCIGLHKMYILTFNIVLVSKTTYIFEVKVNIEYIL